MELEVIDSHTGGEPTRTVIRGFPDLGGGTIAERREVFKENFDHFRRAIAMEPRGSDVLVGALLTSAEHAGSAAGVIFFNNVGYLGMCGHGTIGVVESLRWLGGSAEGSVVLDTAVGSVTAEILPSGEITISNVPSYRYAKDVEIEVPGVGQVKGDVAYGGNWFFLVRDTEYSISLANSKPLTQLTESIMAALRSQGIAGKDGAEIDHVELFGQPQGKGSDSRNFVLCPGGAYDRSPCGTGTSAKLACLAGDGLLGPGEEYVQESVTGSTFRCSYELATNGPTGPVIIPKIIGRAHVTARSTLMLNEGDPLCWGLG